MPAFPIISTLNAVCFLLFRLEAAVMRCGAGIAASVPWDEQLEEQCQRLQCR